MSSDNDRTLSPTEEAIAEIWRSLFQVTEVARDDDFFELGGNSLTAIKFLSRVEERFGEDALLPETLYEDARLSSLGKAVEAATATAGPSA